MPSRFRHQALIVAVLLASVGLLSLRFAWPWYRNQQVRAQVIALGGTVVCVDAPRPFRSILGEWSAKRLFNTIVEIHLGSTPTENRHLSLLDDLPDLEVLHLNETQITDAGLVHLRGLSQLHLLRLHGTQISSEGLKEVVALTNLRELSLPGSALSDADITELQHLPQLKSLAVRGDTQLTLSGLDRLKETLPGLTVYW